MVVGKNVYFQTNSVFDTKKNSEWTSPSRVNCYLKSGWSSFHDWLCWNLHLAMVRQQTWECSSWATLRLWKFPECTCVSDTLSAFWEHASVCEQIQWKFIHKYDIYKQGYIQMNVNSVWAFSLPRVRKGKNPILLSRQSKLHKIFKSVCFSVLSFSYKRLESL